MFWAPPAEAGSGCHFNLFCFTKKDLRLHPWCGLNFTYEVILRTVHNFVRDASGKPTARGTSARTCSDSPTAPVLCAVTPKNKNVIKKHYF